MRLEVDEVVGGIARQYAVEGELSEIAWALCEIEPFRALRVHQGRAETPPETKPIGFSEAVYYADNRTIRFHGSVLGVVAMESEDEDLSVFRVTVGGAPR